MNASVSARKIGANLWEIQPQFNFQKLDIDDNIHQRHRRHHSFENQVPDNNSQPCEDFDQLLKVLDRISLLEEQHSRDTVLIKSLKHDLDISRAQIKTLIEERKRDHQEIQELKKSTHERKGKNVRSTKNELLEVKSMFMQEKKTRGLLESLCDEFAKGIKDYEQKVRILQQNRDQIVSRNKPDELILHVSEAWLDERMQMNHDFDAKKSISDDLCCEIETFLEMKKKNSCGVLCEPSSRRDRVGVKTNTLMAKLVEARLESQFLKSRKVRK